MCGGKKYVSPPFMHGKSRMRKRACTDLRRGRSAMVVPTATAMSGHLGSSFEKSGHLAVQLAYRTLRPYAPRVGSQAVRCFLLRLSVPPNVRRKRQCPSLGSLGPCPLFSCAYGKSAWEMCLNEY